MRPFLQPETLDRLATPEIVAMLGAIHEYKDVDNRRNFVIMSHISHTKQHSYKLRDTTGAL